jgi:hypothetical protein
VKFYSEILIPNEKLRNNITIDIVFVKGLETYGSAEISECNTSRKPRVFNIELHPGIGAKRILGTLAHEMVHIKQYVYGELDDNLSVWRGVKVNSDDLDYWWHPWEIEAFGTEAGLLRKFVEAEKLWKIFSDIENPDSPIISKELRWKA